MCLQARIKKQNSIGTRTAATAKMGPANGNRAALQHVQNRGLVYTFLH